MSEPNQLATADDHQEPLVQEEKKNVRRRGRRGGMKRQKVTKKKHETAQMLMEMGDPEAYNTIKTMDTNKAKTLQNQKIKLELEQKFQEVVAKHKQLTQNNSSILPVETILPVVSKAEAKKIRQAQQRREPYYSIQQRTVTEEILHVISTIPTLLQTQKPLTSTITREQSMLQQPELNAATMAPGQSTSTSGQNSWQQQGPFPATTSKQSVLQNAKTGELNTQHSLFWDTPAKVTRRNKKGKKNKMALLQTPQRAYTVNAGPSQFQAPHQNEPEDLTDDLAPNMAGQSAQPQASPQQRPVTTENKLNFKFQRTAPKNPDWSEYQDKFKRIGGASPDGEPGETDKEVKQEPNTDQSMNTGAANGNQSTETPATAGQSQQATKAAPKIMIQKVEILKPAGKSTEIPLKPIKVRCSNTPSSTNFQPDPNMYSFPATSDTFVPKGIPKTFLQQEKRNPDPPPQSPTSQSYPVYFPAGIPKSFVLQERMQQKFAEAQLEPATINPEPVDYNSQPATHVDLPSWILPSQAQKPPPLDIYEGLEPNVRNPPNVRNEPNVRNPPNEPMPDRAYSPSDTYSDAYGRTEEELREGSESPDILQSGQKRLSAFKRLGPLTQPKKPKLTINLTLNKEQAVREVVDETDDSYRFIPVHLRKDILESSDETVVKYLPFWPWKKNIALRKTASARFSKSVMILETEQMETEYEKNNIFIQVSVKGYPKTWSKEDVLDAVLDCVKGKSFIPCFIEFTQNECKFLVIRCRAALVAIHRVGFCIRKDNVELTVSISLTDTSLNQIDLIPRLVLRKRLMNQYDGEKALDLQEFLTEKDVSHFVYFPLHRVTNQMELVQLQSAVSWEHLTELNLSRNRITSLDGFDLNQTTPRLKILDLSHNYLDKLTILIRLRDLPLRSLKLEGNPLCHDYIDCAHYIKVVKMIFSGIKELDGVRITLKGDFPPPKRNYSPQAAVPIVEKFLEVFFPLLEAPYDDRAAIEDLYDKDAVMTITFRYKLRYGTAYRYFRNLFLRARSLEENDLESVKGAATIGSLICKWPAIEHDRYTITVDVLHHDDYTTILRLGGVLKLTADSLAEDEHLLTFSRNIVLHSRNGAEYKIHNEMLYWDVPCEEAMRTAFNVTTVRPKQLSVKLESPPDEDLKAKLVDIFVKLAEIDKKRGARCLELKNWDLRSALEYYISLLKLDDLKVLGPPQKRTSDEDVPDLVADDQVNAAFLEEVEPCGTEPQKGKRKRCRRAGKKRLGGPRLMDGTRGPRTKSDKPRNKPRFLRSSSQLGELNSQLSL